MVFPVNKIRNEEHYVFCVCLWLFLWASALEVELHPHVGGQVPHQEGGTILDFCQQGMSSLFAHGLPALEIVLLNKLSFLLLKIVEHVIVW